MANEFQDSIFRAIDTLLEKRVENLDVDKTITATIDTCANLLENLYVINYQGGKTYAYAQSDETYTKDQQVYVLVPEGDFSKKKIIIGKASISSSNEQGTYVSSVLNDYNVVGSNAVDDKGQRFGLHSFRREDYIVLYDAESDTNMIDVDVESVEVYLKDASAVTIRASFNTADLPKEHKKSANGNYGLIFNLLFKDRSDETASKNVTYVLDTRNMTGNPFQYNTDITQYEVFPFDAENFIRIESIIAFCEDFVEQTDNKNDKLYGADIFIKGIEFYGLKEISSEMNGYKLRISTPKGSIFKDTYANNHILEAKAELVYKDNMNLSDKASFFWFREDARVASTSSEYNYYGGAGWACLNDGEALNVNVYHSIKENNRAYENNYLCVCVYENNVVLKAYFTLYNDSNRRIIEIDASPAKRFSFDRGEVNLTCKMKLKPDDDEFITDFTSPLMSIYSFYWTKMNPGGGDTLYNQTVEEIQELIDEENAKETPSMSTLVSLRNRKASLEGILWDKNRFTYPVKNIENSATFKCSVYIKDSNSEYLLGSAVCTIENEDAAEPTDYYIIIENGDQVFQYSESGVSPCDERYKDPLEVYNLKCHFIDPAGLEVKPTTYSLKWKFPTESSLIVKPTAGVYINPSNGIYEWLYSDEYPLAIADNYDYQALNNQVTAIVTYDGIEYTKETNLLFVKVGDNGTNGTDIVAKIDIPYAKDGELPYIACRDGYNDIKWSDGTKLSDKTLIASLYQRNQLITDSSVRVSWDISGKATLSKRMGVSGGVIEYSDTERTTKGSLSNQVVKATLTYNNEVNGVSDKINTYYAFAGIPVVLYHSNDIEVIIDKRRTLKDILYNADGRNPLYNKNQGVFVTLLRNGQEIKDKIISWETVGGVNDIDQTSARTSDLDVIENKDDKKSLDSVLNLGYNDEDKAYRVYVLPHDAYNGASTNNMVHGWCDEFDIYVPIHMSLNTFGLASLNSWDGNHIEINEDDNYIMAPQIGAGVKDENNRFTGVVMGSSQTYDQKDQIVGLLGYSKGEQSIFLDAETGDATFGLPPVDVRASSDGTYRFTEGRVEIRPGGTSTIGNWKIGSDFIYNSIGYNSDGVPNGLDEPYDDLKRQNNGVDKVDQYKQSIPHHTNGILLSSNPAYMSIKGKILRDTTQWRKVGNEYVSETNRDYTDFDSSAGNAIIYDGDTFELELNPNARSLFTIYRHSKNDDAWSNEHNGVPSHVEGRSVDWFRTPMVGIDNAGRFYTNSIKEEGAALTLNYVPAFGSTVAGRKFKGVNIEIGFTGDSTLPLVKMFADVSELGTSTSTLRQAPLYISGGSTTDNEYARPLSIHGKTISMYSTEKGGTLKTTDHRLRLTDNVADFGHFGDYKAYLSLDNSGNSAVSKLFTDYSLSIESVRDYTATVGANYTATVGKTATVDITEDVKLNVSKGNIDVTQPDNKYLKFTNGVYNFDIVPNNEDKGFILGNSDDHISLKGFGSKNIELKTSSSTLRLWGKESGISIVSENDADGIKLQAKATTVYTGDYSSEVKKGHASIDMVPSQSGNTGYISFITDDGQALVGGKLTSGATATTGVIFSPGIGTNFGYFSGTFINNDTLKPNSSASNDKRPELSVTQSELENTSLFLRKDMRIIEGWGYAGSMVMNELRVSDDYRNPRDLTDPVNNFSSGNTRVINKGWLDEIQNLYNHWDKNQNNGKFPRPETDLTSINTAISNKAKKNTSGLAPVTTLSYNANNVPSAYSQDTFIGILTGLANAITRHGKILENMNASA